MKPDYYLTYDHRKPPLLRQMSPLRLAFWHFFASLTVGVAIWYLYWRWTSSLNPEAMVFSVAVAVAETLTFVGTLLFFHDIWRPKDTEFDVWKLGSTSIDIFITTFDEETQLVERSVHFAKDIEIPTDVRTNIFVLDDGNRPSMRQMAAINGVGYQSRSENVGYKAGNLKHALFRTSGDFVIICDADTILSPSFLVNTLGYFNDPNVAWVQTPHWFYDIPTVPRFPLTPKFLNGAFRSKHAKTQDPFLSDPSMFFDVIQRRRNRNGASFCCGAGSIHRRSALFEVCLFEQLEKVKSRSFGFGNQQTSILASARSEPFRFHVSEDLLTSIKIHASPTSEWRSVFHPKVETKMLSPWSLKAWSIQRLKYAGGTFDIFFKHNPLFSRSMKTSTKLHYLSTFWSYFSVLWAPFLLLAPVITLTTGIAPIDSFSLEFFLHLLPLLVLNEIALLIGCGGHNISIGRTLNLVCIPIHLRALVLVLLGRKPKFPATPKTPMKFTELQFIWPYILIVATNLAAVGIGFTLTLSGHENFSWSLFLVNLFWVLWNTQAYVQIIRAGYFDPKKAIEIEESRIGSLNV